MSNYQTARESLGARMREMRAEAGLTGREFAERLGWPPSKVSKLEHGRQTPTAADLSAWAKAAGQPDAQAELTARLRQLETHYAAWRRQLAAGVRARQEAWGVDERNTTEVRVFESSCVPGLLQTPEYARHMFELYRTLLRTPIEVEEGVRARMRRQQVLYEPGRTFRFLLWEAALHTLLCPREVMAGQLDRIAGAVGLDAIRVGIVPLGTPMAVVPGHGFWIYDQRLVRIETNAAELRLVESDEIAVYLESWRRLEEVAVFGPAAHRVLTRARAALENDNQPKL